ncbi:MAG: hypothetical protein J1F11_13765, partial [Oscillospiraceae bacterium]|nr:hypothetical protein [Oscillospiraceae bacterium]
MKKIKNYIIGSLTILYAFFLVVFVKDVTAAVLGSVRVCLEVMIPSLYAFIVISGFIVSSGLYAVLSKPFGFISRYIFRIPREYFSVFLIGSVGGYPVGARLLSDMVKEDRIDRDTASHMLSYCYLAGPAFICGIAGVKLFSSVRVGMLIFAAIISANLITAFFSGLGRPVPPKSAAKIKLDMSFDCLLRSISSGAAGMFSICGIIVFFSSIICILDKLNIIRSAAGLAEKLMGLSYADSIAAVKSFIEISNIASLTPGNYDLIPLAAALLSFGGICVLMQIQGFASGALSTKRFYLSRTISMFISYFLCKILIVASNINSVYVTAPAGVAARQNSPIPTIFLLIMTILLLSNISMAK